MESDFIEWWYDLTFEALVKLADHLDWQRYTTDGGTASEAMLIVLEPAKLKKDVEEVRKRVLRVFGLLGMKTFGRGKGFDVLVASDYEHKLNGGIYHHYYVIVKKTTDGKLDIWVKAEHTLREKINPRVIAEGLRELALTDAEDNAMALGINPNLVRESEEEE